MYKSGNRRAPNKTGKPNELFFPALAKEVSEDDLKEFYCDFGEVESAKVIRKGKGGFAFLRFSQNDSVGRAMAGRPHIIKGASVTPIRAELGDSPFRTVQVRRLFVGNLTTPELRNDTKLRSVFSKYGSIEEIKFKNDDEGNARNFAVIAYADPDSVDKAILAGKHSIDGQDVKIKKFLNDEEGKEARQRARDKKQRNERSGRDQFLGDQGRFGGRSFPAMGGAWGSGGFAGGAAYGGMSYGGPLMGQTGGGYGAGMGSGYGDMNGYGQRSGGGGGGAAASSGDPSLKTILLKAKVSEDALGILARERLLDTELLRSTTVEDLAQLGVPFGDRKRIQILMS
jgi:hypothetical protein